MTSRARDLIQFVIACFRWLASFAHVFVVLAPPLAAFLWLAFIPGKLEDQIRCWGLVLQLLGVATVALLLRHKATIFERSVLEYMRVRTAARPKFRSPEQTIAVSGFDNLSPSISDHASVLKIPASTTSVEGRLSILEHDIEALRTTLKRHEEQARETLTDLKAEFNREIKIQTDFVESLRQQFVRVEADGLPIELAGVIWLALGILMATIPAELARFLGLEQ